MNSSRRVDIAADRITGENCSNSDPSDNEDISVLPSTADKQTSQDWISYDEYKAGSGNPFAQTNVAGPSTPTPIATTTATTTAATYTPTFGTPGFHAPRLSSIASLNNGPRLATTGLATIAGIGKDTRKFPATKFYSNSRNVVTFKKEAHSAKKALFMSKDKGLVVVVVVVVVVDVVVVVVVVVVVAAAARL